MVVTLQDGTGGINTLANTSGFSEIIKTGITSTDSQLDLSHDRRSVRSFLDDLFQEVSIADHISASQPIQTLRGLGLTRISRGVRRFCYTLDIRDVYDDLRELEPDILTSPPSVRTFVADLIEALEVTTHAAFYEDVTNTTKLEWLPHLIALLAKIAEVADLFIGILYCDFNNLKVLNDHPQVGHDIGDEYMRRGVALMRATARPEDVVLKIGGDEYVRISIFQTEMPAIQQALRTTARIQQELRDEDILDSKTCRILRSLLNERGGVSENILSLACGYGVHCTKTNMLRSFWISDGKINQVGRRRRLSLSSLETEIDVKKKLLRPIERAMYCHKRSIKGLQSS